MARPKLEDIKALVDWDYERNEESEINRWKRMFMDYIFDKPALAVSFIAVAIECNYMKLLELVLNDFNIPTDLTLKQRLSYYYLLKN